MIGIERTLGWVIRWIQFAVLIGITLRIAQVLYLGSIEAVVDSKTGNIVSRSATDDERSRSDFIPYGEQSLFDLIVRGVFDKVDDQSFIHLLMIGVSAYMITVAGRRLLPTADEDVISVAIVVKRLLSSPIYMFAVATAVALYFIAISDQPGHLRGTFFVTTDNNPLPIRLIQYSEGIIHVLTAPVAFLAIPAAWSIRKQLSSILSSRPSNTTLMGIDMLLNVGLSVLLFGCSYFLIVHHVLIKVLPYVFKTYDFGEFLAGTVLYTWPYVGISLFALSDVARSQFHRLGVTKLSDVKDGRFFVFFCRNMESGDRLPTGRRIMDAEPPGPANGSQPSSPDSNRTSAAPGSRR